MLSLINKPLSSYLYTTKYGNRNIQSNWVGLFETMLIYRDFPKATHVYNELTIVSFWQFFGEKKNVKDLRFQLKYFYSTF